MSVTTDQIQLDAYGPERFAEHQPFGRVGYLFTVPGDFPADVPPSLNVTDWEMAVYRTRASAAECWEVRDVNGHRKVWAEADTRREAVGLAFNEIARIRRERVAETAERRVNILGLAPVADTADAHADDTGGSGPAVDPVADALSEQFENAYLEAKRIRRAALAAAAVYAAHLIRPHLPTAAALTVDVTNGGLRAVLDPDRKALWYAPACPVGLDDATVEEVEGLMRDALEFGADEKSLEEAGWHNPGAYDDTYDLELPQTQ
ncbi:hypothetical protein [Streptomyces sp. NBC_01763]|uniref:hypothetical protein n=1 Tax=Streptomyces sp. NBC_01763 TaxID=2975934 RepID=UPI002DD8EA76|nr:hypothetical protein [Streptomyces sp. NBC_01763]WSC35618.1 hypothetical protein OHA08_08970 [Streptomyces sp. NBC_01763]